MTQADLPLSSEIFSPKSSPDQILTSTNASCTRGFSTVSQELLRTPSTFLRTALSFGVLSLAMCFTSSAFAAELARWDFEDGDLVADSASATNISAVFVSTDPTPTFAAGDGSASAANFNSLNVNQVSAIETSINTEGFDLVTLQFSARTSNTASKYWRLQADDGTGFVDVAPLLEFTGSATFVDFDVQLPSPTAGPSLSVRIVASDDAGDGTGIFVQADGVGVPSSSGTFRLDNVVFTGATDPGDAGILVSDGGVAADGGGQRPDGGVVVNLDGGAEVNLDGGDAGGPVVSPLQITEIFFNAASGSDSGKEWLEIENISAAPVSLDGWTLQTFKNLTPVIETEVLLSGATLAPGQLLLIAQSDDLGAEVCLNVPRVLVDVSSFALGHSAGNQFVKLIAPAELGVDLFHQVQYVGGGLSASTFNGLSLDVATNAPSTCTPVADFAGSPGTTDVQCNVLGLDFCSGEDGGVLPMDDAGQVEPEPDPAANNTAPEISLSAPTGENNTTNITISYLATDPDDDVVDVAFFYDTDGQGFDGVRIVEGLPGGAKDYVWNTTGTPAGRYRVFGRVTDVFGVQTYAYADGNVQVGEPIAENATLVFVEPDGVNDASEDGSILISFIAEMPANATGTVSLFYDSDQEGGDGTPLAAALQVVSGEEVFFVWDTSEVAAGSYAIAAVFTWTGGTVVNHSEFVQISGGCSCTVPSKKNQWGQILLSLSALAMLCFPRRRRKRALLAGMR